MNVDKWNPGDAAVTRAARNADSLSEFYLEQRVVAEIIAEHTRRFDEACDTIGCDDAVTLAKRIKWLYLMNHPFNGRDDYRAFLAGRCLTLKESPADASSERQVEYITATAKVASTSGEYPRWRGCTISIPVELESAFGVQSLSWLSARCKAVARDRIARVDEGQYSLGGDFAFTVDPASRGVVAEQGSIRVMPAPDEAGISSSVDAAALGSDGRDHWNALSAAAAMLLRFRQPLGGILSGWVADVLDGKVTRPDGRKSARWPKNKLRDATIAEAIGALMRCGMRAMTNDRSPGPTCGAVAKAFCLSEATVLDIWKASSH